MSGDPRWSSLPKGGGEADRTDSEMSTTKRALLEIRELKAKLAEAKNLAAKDRYEPIAIVGAGMRFPGQVKDADSFWALLAEGRDAITDIPKDRWDWRQYYDANPDIAGTISVNRGGFLEDIDLFDASFFGISPREAAMLDPQQRLLHETAWHALENAAIPADRLRGSRSAVFAGVSNFDYYRAALEDDQTIDAYVGSGNSPSMAAGRLAYTFGFHGPAITVDTSCSSSLVAMHLASQSLRANECDLALVGGVNVILAPQMHIGFSHAHMLAPDGLCKTFDRTANGYVRSEGCAVVVLKRLSDAVAAGDRVMAVVRASATNHDGRSGGLTAPSRPAQAALLREAYAKAGIHPQDVGMIEAHGTGTSLGDPIEMEALSEVFLDRPSGRAPIAVGSVKTNLGHTEAASGMAGLLKAVLALQHGQIPPHLNCHNPTSLVPWDQIPFSIPATCQDWALEEGQHRRVAGVSSFGFSGSNAHLVLEEFVDASTSTRPVRHRIASIAAISAKTETALERVRQQLLDRVEKDPQLPIEDLCQTTTRGRVHHAYRQAFCVRSREELLSELSNNDLRASCATADGSSASICFLFTGQGSEYTGMGLNLLETSGVFRSAVARLDAIIAADLGASIKTIWANEHGELGCARLLQPALFAYEWALSEVWRDWGVRPRIVLGHSLGEYVAATVAGGMSPEDAIRLVAARGRLTEQLAGPGSMVAIAGSTQEVARLMRSFDGNSELSVAAINTPTNTVVAGPPDVVSAFELFMNRESFRTRRLQTTHGFHSATIEPLLDAFEAEAAKLQYRHPEVTWISNLTGAQAGGGRAVDASYWRSHLRETVRFAEGLKTADAIASPIFLELGPKPQLVTLAEAAGVPSNRCIASLGHRPSDSEWERLLFSASRLYVEGEKLDWDAVCGHGLFRKAALPPYPFERKRFWLKEQGLSEQEIAEGLAEAAASQAAMVPIDLDVARIEDHLKNLNAWASGLMAFTLKQLGCFDSPDEIISIRRLLERHGLSAIQGRLLSRWLRRLCDMGLLSPMSESLADDYRVHRHLAIEDPGVIWLGMQAQLRSDEPLRDYLANCTRLLLPVLQGKVSALDTLFPKGQPDLATALYERSPASAYVNRIAAAVISARCRAGVRTGMGYPRRLRILEVGGGTGATTASILSQVARSAVTYTFTDLSEVFLTRARARFRSHAMEFALFDLDREDHAEAHEGRYDVVIIANALHAAKDLTRSLRRIRHVLQPGGTLLLIETTAAQAWHDVSTGLLEGWQHAEDAREEGSPLLDVARWHEELAGAGFLQTSSTPRPGMATDALGLHVFLAHKPPQEISEFPPQNPIGLAHRGTSAPQPVRPGLNRIGPEEGALSWKSPPSQLRTHIEDATPRQRHALVLEAVAKSVAAVLGRSELPHRGDRLMELGLDSLMAIELRDRLQSSFGLDELESTLIFDYPTSEAIATLLLKRLGYEGDGNSSSTSAAEKTRAVHSNEEPDAFSDDAIAELLRMHLDD